MDTKNQVAQFYLVGPLYEGLDGFFPITISTMSMVVAFHLYKISAKVVKIMQKKTGKKIYLPKVATTIIYLYFCRLL